MSKKVERKGSFKSISGDELKDFYSSSNKEKNYNIDPGSFPYTRGIHKNMYRGKLWTMRQFSGFSTPEKTNERYKYLLKNGQTGLSVAYDMPTLMGYDPDHELSSGEVGVCGVNVASLKDMEILFDGINLENISVSQTINGPAIILFAFYVALAKKNGIDISKLRGTLQNDALKEYMAQKEWIFPPEPSVKLVVDIIEYCSENMPLYNPVSVSGYHIREAASTAAQELAFTLNNGFAYIEEGHERGLKIDNFAHRLSFFFNAHMDFFEEIAKYRAARRIWANRLKNQYGAKNESSLKLETMGRGISWLDTGTFESMHDASSYVRTIQNRQGYKIGCIEEVAWRNGWICDKKLFALANSQIKSEYGKYLLKLLQKQ